jgi:hypothetical protein
MAELNQKSSAARSDRLGLSPRSPRLRVISPTFSDAETRDSRSTAIRASEQHRFEPQKHLCALGLALRSQ